MNELALRCKGVVKRFERVTALDDFELGLKRGTLLALLGPSGCGKTTALRVMAGFERPDAGEVWVGDEIVASQTAWVAPEKRRIGMVFQDWALFPHLDVWSNIAYGLPRGEVERVRRVLELVDLVGLERRMPHELSGGQQQRVALARALAPEPRVVLLDEPFSSLDATLRSAVRSEVRSVLKEAGATAIFVTHDQEEALSMADELAVMIDGRVLQAGTPHEVYQTPANQAAATLVGESNFVPGRAARGMVETALGSFLATGVGDGDVQVLIRPEAVSLRADAAGRARIVHTEFYGHDQLVRAALPDGTHLDVRLLGPHPELSMGATTSVEVIGPVTFFRNGMPLLSRDASVQVTTPSFGAP